MIESGEELRAVAEAEQYEKIDCTADSVWRAVKIIEELRTCSNNNCSKSFELKVVSVRTRSNMD
jgi:hypothetical protein